MALATALTLWLATGWLLPARAETITVTVTGGGSNLGTVVTGTSSTTFTIGKTGAVTQTPAVSAGGASRLTAASVTALKIRVACSNPSGSSSNDCRGETYSIQVTESSGSGNLATLDCDNTSGIASNVNLKNCSTNDSTTNGSYVRFEVEALSGAASTWTVDVPLSFTTTVSATQRASMTRSLTCSRFSGQNISGSCTSPAAITLKAIRNVSVVKNSDLAFGTLLRPRSGSGSVVLVAASGARSSTGAAGFVPGSSASAAEFTVTGEGGQAIVVDVPATVTLSNGSSTLTVATSDNLPGGTASQTLGGTLGTDATLVVKVGGAIDLASSTPTGNYSGTLTVTASYQ